MKYLFLFVIGLSFISCDTEETTEEPVVTKEIDNTPEGTLEEILVSHMESKLNITAIEKYEYTIYKEELNRDDSTDWIVTINLYDRAINEAAHSENTAKMAELDYFGNYNYIFYMDGKTKQFSEGVVMPSCAASKLTVGFEHITSSTSKDFVVDLKIRNSSRRRFYTIFNNSPYQTCEEKVYYNFGKEGEETESYVIEYEDVENSSARNILVYEGELEQREFENTKDIYEFEPEIKSTGKLVHKWYFDSRLMKYYMKKGEQL